MNTTLFVITFKVYDFLSIVFYGLDRILFEIIHRDPVGRYLILSNTLLIVQVFRGCCRVVVLVLLYSHGASFVSVKNLSTGNLVPKTTGELLRCV